MLVPPQKTLVPTVNVVSAIGWSGAETPEPAPGLQVAAFARGLDHPRWLYVLPNGDVLVAETNAPPRPEDDKGVRGRLFRHFQKKAGGAAPSANRITLLRDADGDGVAEVAHRVPAGPAFPVRHGAGRRRALRGQHRRGGEGAVPARAPRRIDVAARQGARAAGRPAQSSLDQEHHRQPAMARKLYVAVGSNSNVAEHGMDDERGRARFWESTSPPARTASSPPDCATPSAWPGSRSPARCGSRSTSATSSATTSSPTT